MALTEIRVGPKRPFRIGLLKGILAIIVVLGIQLVLLRELSVFNTGNGNKITVVVDNTTSPYTVLSVQ